MSDDARVAVLEGPGDGEEPPGLSSLSMRSNSDELDRAGKIVVQTTVNNLVLITLSRYSCETFFESFYGV